MKNNQKDKKDNFAETIKKLIEAGAFVTEETVRKAFKGSKIPKDLLNSVRKSLGKAEFLSEATRFIKDHRFKFSVEVEKKSKTTTKNTK